MYAIVKTGGKQYRVERGQSLLVERLPVGDGASVALEPLLYVDGSTVVDGGDGVSVSARVVRHERGPKLRVVKFKPKRGYKRRTGHRQNLTRIEVTEITVGGAAGSAQDVPARPGAGETPRPVAAEPAPPVEEAPIAEVAAGEPIAGEDAPAAAAPEDAPAAVATEDAPAAVAPEEAPAAESPATTTEEDADGA